MFEELFTSSLFVGTDETPPERHASDVRLRVWLVMLGRQRDGVYSSSVIGIAKDAHCRLDQTLRAVEELESPDPYSRSRAEDGRRIVRIDGDEVAWRLVNSEKYRMLASKEGRKAYMREFMRDKRADESERGREAKALVDHWHAEHVRTRGSKPLVVKGAAAMQAAKRYLAAATLDALKAAVTEFMEATPPFYEEKNLLGLESIGRELDKIVRRAQPGPTPQPVDDPRRRGRAERK